MKNIRFFYLKFFLFLFFVKLSICTVSYACLDLFHMYHMLIFPGFTEVDGKSVDIFTRELNWFEAQSQCRADGYLRMDYTVPASRKIDSIAQAFRDYG